MFDRRKKLTDEAAFLLLLTAYIVLCVLLGVANLKLCIIALCVGLAAVILFLINLGSLRNTLDRAILGTKQKEKSTTAELLNSLPAPALVTDSSGKVLWYNRTFSSTMLKKGDSMVFEYAQDVLRDYDVQKLAEAGEDSIEFRGRHYDVFAAKMGSESSTSVVSIFNDDTEEHADAVEYRRSRPVVLMFVIDNYEELFSSTSETDRSDLLLKVNNELDKYVSSYNGILMHLSSKDFVAIVEERSLDEMLSGKFKILDTVRNIKTDSIPMTLSIGVGRGGKDYREDRVLARDALNMALGRGGDQAAMRTSDGFSFYGGTTKAVERRNKVKARIVATALGDIVKSSTKIMISGHRFSDNDSLGSAIGVAKIAQVYGKEAKIVIDPKTTLAKSLYRKALVTGMNDKFLSPDSAMEYADSGTLLIVVDCHSAKMLDRPEIAEKAGSLAVIDHHRLTVDMIENAALFYHETSSSSCSELVTELVEYLSTAEIRLNPFEATALLSGIMLDTKNFSLQTGVRTYDAASYLRSAGADPIAARGFFSTSFDTYRLKVKIVSEADIYRGCAVAVVTDADMNDIRLAAPQAADELLNVDGVKASIVAALEGEEYRLSARSLGEYNVQLIMEKLGGGGHQTMAGAQIKSSGMTPSEMRDKIHSAIDEYIMDNRKEG
ncbi:MAG: DHH family phosphoesterase [Oscillospiraceae bacterium]|jgi:c-di-AMP phosphodiesterase-like protein